MAVSKRLRFEILRRDNHTCRYCGMTAPASVLTVDHVIPVALGGSDEPTNLVAACRDCNAGKSSVPAEAPLVDDVAADAIRWARAIKQVAEIRQKESDKRDEVIKWFTGVWEVWTYGRDEKTVPADDYTTVLKFLDLGMTHDELYDLVGVAMRAKHIPPSATWRYFCGCCWKRIRENQEMAAEILKAEEN